MEKKLPFMNLVEDSIEHVYFLRSWWDGRGSDVSIWWKTVSKECHYFCCVTGETLDRKTNPVVLKDLIIPINKFDKMLNALIHSGMLEIKSQDKPEIMTHFDDFYSVSLKNGNANFYKIRCGKHLDPRAEEIIDLIFENSPELFKFYNS